MNTRIFLSLIMLSAQYLHTQEIIYQPNLLVCEFHNTGYSRNQIRNIEKISWQEDFAEAPTIKQRLAACWASRKTNDKNELSIQPKHPDSFYDPYSLVVYNPLVELSWRDSWPSTHNAKKEIEDALAQADQNPSQPKIFKNLPDHGNYNQNDYVWPSYFQREPKFHQGKPNLYPYSSNNKYYNIFRCNNKCSCSDTCNVGENTYCYDPGILEKSPGCPKRREKSSCYRACRSKIYCSCPIEKYDEVKPSEFRRTQYRQLNSTKLPIYRKRVHYGLSTRWDDSSQPFVPGKFIDASKEFPAAHIQPISRQLTSSNLPVYEKTTPTNTTRSLSRIAGAITTFVPGKFTDPLLTNHEIQHYSERQASNTNRFQDDHQCNNADCPELINHLLISLSKKNCPTKLKDLYHKYINEHRDASVIALESGFIIFEDKRSLQSIEKEIADALGPNIQK